MTQWFYLAFAFALLSTLQRGQARSEGAVRAIWIFSFRLTAAVGVVGVIQNICNVFAWGPSGRNDLGRTSLFLWAILLDGCLNGFRKKDRDRGEPRLVVSRFSLALFAFSFWTIGGDWGTVPELPLQPLLQRFLWGLSLPLATGFFEWLLGGLWNRLRLSAVPAGLTGPPIIFWLAMLLALGICKLG